MADSIRVDHMPDLRKPVLLAAFEGWNDASSVATGALRLLVRRWSGTRFAQFDPEDFYVFTETRPHVRHDDQGQRTVTWPENTFWECRGVHLESDVVVLIGVEPQLRWRTFTGAIVDLIEQLGVEHVISLGGLLADVPHTMPVELSGSSTLLDVREKLDRLGIGATKYQGPTGIVGVLADACRKRSIPSGSIWGSVPVYLRETVPNPPVQTALLRTVSGLLDLGLDLKPQEQEAARFVRSVNEAVSGNSSLVSHIRSLEQRHGSRASDGQDEPSPLPNGEDLVRDLEEFLRRQSGNQGTEEQG